MRQKKTIHKNIRWYLSEGLKFQLISFHTSSDHIPSTNIDTCSSKLYGRQSRVAVKELSVVEFMQQLALNLHGNIHSFETYQIWKCFILRV